jgi:protein-S-isoprenylcysteine O-methyltransferase Ste14
MPTYLYFILLVSWIAWVSAFLTRKRTTTARQINPRARWGILLEAVGFGLLWQGHFWERDPGWRVIPAVALFSLAAVLSWTGVAALGKQWRIDAGLNPDHQLIRSGPYAIVRHPIYASMFCLLLGTGLLVSPWPLFLAAVTFFLIGTEIRVRIEDSLLAAQFDDDFAAYKRAIPAYIPWLR